MGKRNIYSLREKENGEGKNIDRAIFSREKEIMKKREGKVLPTFFLLQNLYYAHSIIDYKQII